MKNLFIIFLMCLFFPVLMHAQFQADDAATAPYTPENLISNYFLGQGIEVVSIKYDGPPQSVGYFQNGTGPIGIDRGIVMTTGAVTGNPALNINGVVNNGKVFASTNNQSTVNDPDLNKIATGQTLNTVVYTIKFIPTSDTIRFKYVFASEEYPEYACGNVNDCFGFFISGPGINGTFSNNGKNIALIPGTNLNVSINNVHPNNPALAPCPAKNAQYYISNDGSNKNPVFDGILKVFTAEAIVVPCQVYTIKLAIADVGDSAYDSGVFLEAKSFGAAAVKVATATASLDGAIAEGCSNGKATFRLPKKTNADYIIDAKIIGTAINGIDYNKVTLPLVIPKGDSILTIPLIGIMDNIKEGAESIGFDVQRDPCHRDTFWIYIEDNKLPKPNLGADITLCAGDSVTLKGLLPTTLPPNPYFENKTKYKINTIAPSSINVLPTISGINVFGVNPIELDADVLKSVCFNMVHPWIDDIDAFLVAPSGQYIELSTDNGADGGNDSDDDFYKNTCFSPKATKRIAPVGGYAPPSDVPFTGTYLPEGPFTDLWSADKNPVNGLWQLQVKDDATGFVGDLLDWNITFNSVYRNDYKWTPTTGLSCSDCPNPIARPSKSTTYILEVSDNYGCFQLDTIKITIKDTLEAPKVICLGSTQSSITFGWNDVKGNKGYIVSLDGIIWSPANGTLQHEIKNLNISTSIQLFVRAISDCYPGKIGSTICKTKDCETPQISIVKQKDVTCFGKTDGEIEVIASKGTAPYIYFIDNILNPNQVFKNLSAGTHIIKIEESKGCSDILQVIVNEPLALNMTPKTDSTACAGASNGTATFTITGGTAGYSFKWQNGDISNQISNLKKGIYTATVTDKNGCTASQVAEVFDKTYVQVVPTLSTDTICDKTTNGQLKVTVKGGNIPYSYSWSNKATQANISNLAVGKYTVIVKDKYGCTGTDSSSVFARPIFEVLLSQKGATCHDGNNGSAKVENITINGANVPIAGYTFLWSNGTNSSLANTLKSGVTYSLSTTSKYGCIVDNSIKIDNPVALEAKTIAIQDTKCSDSVDGSITVQGLGGTSPYTYKWDAAAKNQTTAIANNLIKGAYNVTVTDVNNCTASATNFVKTPNEIKTTFVKTDVACPGESTGSASVVVTGGTPNFVFNWSNGATTQGLKQLSAGNYSVTIIDANQCSNTSNVTIFEPAKGLDAAFTTDDISCFGKKDGSISVVANGGNPPYLYSINGTDFFGASDFFGLKAGNYAVYIKDKGACIVIKSDIEVKEPKKFSVELGADTIIAYSKPLILNPVLTNGIPPFSFVWEKKDSTLMSCFSCKNPKVNTLVSSDYALKVIDANGCKSEDYKKVIVQFQSDVWVPTGFSPNKDSHNDLLLVHGEDGGMVQSMVIYDRWGEQIYQAENFPVNDINTGWDGRFRNADMPTSVYVWHLVVKLRNGKVETFKGQTTLIR